MAPVDKVRKTDILNPNEKDNSDMEGSSKRGEESSPSFLGKSPRRHSSDDAPFSVDIGGKSRGHEGSTSQGSQGSQGSPGSSPEQEGTREHKGRVSSSIDGKYPAKREHQDPVFSPIPSTDGKYSGEREHNDLVSFSNAGKQPDTEKYSDNEEDENGIQEDEDRILLARIRPSLPRGSPTFEQVIREHRMPRGTSSTENVSSPRRHSSPPTGTGNRRVSWADEKGLSLTMDVDV